MTCRNARGTMIGRCGDPDYDLIHIMLLDDNDKPIAQITPNCTEALSIVADIRKTVEGVGTERKLAVN